MALIMELEFCFQICFVSLLRSDMGSFGPPASPLNLRGGSGVRELFLLKSQWLPQTVTIPFIHPDKKVDLDFFPCSVLIFCMRTDLVGFTLIAESQ